MKRNHEVAVTELTEVDGLQISSGIITFDDWYAFRARMGLGNVAVLDSGFYGVANTIDFPKVVTIIPKSEGS